MSDAPTIWWAGQSGKRYQYWIFPLGTTFKQVPGNYVFAKETRPGYWNPCYIGQTKDLSTRLESHEKEVCAKRHDATHIHTHTASTEESVRRTEEADLIKKWTPPCNDQLA